MEEKRERAGPEEVKKKRAEGMQGEGERRGGCRGGRAELVGEVGK